MPVLVLLFLLVPLVELYVIVQASHVFGLGETLVVLVAVSLVGAWLVKVQGLGVVRRFLRAVRSGQVPHRELVDGALVLVAGALLLTPGFVTDALAIGLLVPPVRVAVRTAVLAWLGRRYGVLAVDPRSWSARGPGRGPAPGTGAAPGLGPAPGGE